MLVKRQMKEWKSITDTKTKTHPARLLVLWPLEPIRHVQEGGIVVGVLQLDLDLDKVLQRDSRVSVLVHETSVE